MRIDFEFLKRIIPVFPDILALTDTILTINIVFVGY